VECRAGAEDSGVESRARAFFFLLINEVGRPVAQQTPSEAEEVPDAVQLSRGTMVGPSVSRSPDLRPKNRIDLAISTCLRRKPEGTRLPARPAFPPLPLLGSLPLPTPSLARVDSNFPTKKTRRKDCCCSRSSTLIRSLGEAEATTDR
jgi:hypothetical protein